MKVTIDVSSEEAEMILFALTLRAKQSKLSSELQQQAVSLGNRLNDAFTKAFKWDVLNRMKARMHPIKRVTITLYDFPPEAK